MINNQYADISTAEGRPSIIRSLHAAGRPPREIALACECELEEVVTVLGGGADCGRKGAMSPEELLALRKSVSLTITSRSLSVRRAAAKIGISKSELFWLMVDGNASPDIIEKVKAWVDTDAPRE